MRLAKIQLLKHRINQTLSQVLSGSQPLTWFGPGTLTLTGVNTYIGATTISAGTLELGGAGQLGSGNYSGNITDNATLKINSTANQTLSGVISGSGSLVKDNTGTLTLTGNNTLSGAVTINNGILVGAGTNVAQSALGTASSITVNNGGTFRSGTADNALIGHGGGSNAAITLNTGGTLDTSIDTNTNHLRAITFSGGTLGGTGALSGNSAFHGRWILDQTVTVSAASGATSTISSIGVTLSQSGGTVFNVNASGAASGIDLDVSGSFYHAVGVADSGLIKNGAGVMRLSGTNTYTGTTTVNGGTLALAGPNIKGPLVVNANGTVRWDVNDAVTDVATVTVNGGTLNLTSKSDYINTLSMNSGAQIQGDQSASQYIIVNGSAGAKILGTGGGNAGTISSRIAIASQWGVSTGARTQEFDVASATTLTVSGPIVDYPTGSSAQVGSLLKSNSGTLTLTGANTYTGTTTVSAGTLTISHASGLGTGAVAVNGTLTYTVDTTGTRTVTVNSGGVINKGGLTHSGTTFVNNGGTINA